MYWNNNQKQWEGYQDPEIPGIEVRPYWWGDEDSVEARKPNFKYGRVEIRFYKNPGRGMSCNVDWSELPWRLWFDKCLVEVRKAEKKAY